MGRLGLIFLLGLSGCASSVPRTVPRVVDGAVERGSLVSPYAYEWFLEAEVAAAKGQHEEAALAFEKASAAPAHDVVLMTRLAEEYELSGAARRADRALSVARRYFPESARVSLAEGRIQEHRGEEDAALAAFARASRVDRHSTEPVIEMARTMEARGQTRRASSLLLEHVRRAGDASARDALRELTALAKRTGDARLLERALSQDSSTNPQDRALRAGQMALEHQRPALAARILRDELSSTGNVELWLQALVASGARNEATRFLVSGTSARFLRPEKRAEILLQIDRPEPALELLRQEKSSSELMYAEGRALLASGEYVDAATVLSDVPFGSAAFEPGRVALADCSLSQRRSGAAAESLSVTPHASLAVRQKLASIYLEEGDLGAGLRLFDARRGPERAALAAIFERAGQFEEAAAYYAAARIGPDVELRIRARSSAEQLVLHGDEEAAIVILERWAQFAPEDLYARVRLVELLQSAGAGENATKQGRDTLTLVDEPVLREHLIELLGRSVTEPD